MTIPAGLLIPKPKGDPLDALWGDSHEGGDVLDALWGADEHTKGKSSPAPAVRPDATRALPQNREDASGDIEATAPVVLGPVAALLRDIPGGEAAQAIARALARNQTYARARADIRAAEDDVPVPSALARVAGGALAASRLPGGAARQGALFGAAQGIAQSDPSLSLKQRVDDAGKGMAVGGVTGAVASNASRIPWGGIAATVSHPRAAAVKAIGSVLRDAIGEANAPVATEVAEAAVPSADGFIGNGMDNVIEAIKSRGPKSLMTEVPSPEQVAQVLRDADLSSVTPQAAAWAPRHATQARFSHFAEQLAKWKAANAGTPTP